MKITMPAHLALYFAGAMLPAVSGDDVTPVITGAHLTRHGKALRATATDRYRVHEVTLDGAVTTGKPEESIILPASAMRWIERVMRIIAPRRSDRDTCTVTITTRKVDEKPRALITIAHDEGDSVTLDTATIMGNFPPVSRIIDDAELAKRYTGDVRLNMEFMGKLKALEPSYAPSLILKQTTATGHRAGQPGPLLATANDHGIAVRAMVQPNLMLR